MGHSHTRCPVWDGMRWDVLYCALRCCFFMYMNIHMYKMADDDNDELMLSVRYCELMHINLYWALIGSSLRFYQRRAAQRSAAYV